MIINLDEMDLPKVNLARQTSDELLMKLRLEIDNLIKEFELINNYTFELYQIDSMLLKKVSDNHQNYLRVLLGD